MPACLFCPRCVPPLSSALSWQHSPPPPRPSHLLSASLPPLGGPCGTQACCSPLVSLPAAPTPPPALAVNATHAGTPRWPPPHSPPARLTPTAQPMGPRLLPRPTRLKTRNRGIFPSLSALNLRVTPKLLLPRTAAHPRPEVRSAVRSAALGIPSPPCLQFSVTPRRPTLNAPFSTRPTPPLQGPSE